MFETSSLCFDMNSVSIDIRSRQTGEHEFVVKTFSLSIVKCVWSLVVTF